MQVRASVTSTYKHLVISEMRSIACFIVLELFILKYSFRSFLKQAFASVYSLCLLLGLQGNQKRLVNTSEFNFVRLINPLIWNYTVQLLTLVSVIMFSP